MEKITPRIAPAAPEKLDAETASTLSHRRARLGRVPNALATLAHAPAALDGYLVLSKNLAKGHFNARQREILALALAQANECQYCLLAHTASAKAAGLTSAEMRKARAAQMMTRSKGHWRHSRSALCGIADTRRRPVSPQRAREA
jgi:AhpD family alkylhydroperoxidase